MKKAKIVLYNPQAVFYAMPLALVSLGSCLAPQKYRVRVLDGRLAQSDSSAVLAAVEDAQLLGVTVLTGAPIHDALKVTRAVKAKHPNLPIVWGGWHPSLFPVQTLAEPAIDCTVQGQGEVTFAELVECVGEGDDFSHLAGIAYRRDDQVIKNPDRPLVDMNQLPRANYRLIPTEQYFRLKGKRQLDYISSLGCHHRCAFCADPFVFKNKRVALDPCRIGEEAEFLWKAHQFTELSFQDDSFFSPPKRAAAIAEEFLKRGLKFTWTATLRADQGALIPEAVFELCARSGLRKVIVGVESGSVEMLKWLFKDITIEQVLDTARKCASYAISASFPFIVGFPGESDTSVWETIEMAKRLRAMSPRFETPIFYFKPYPGSHIAARLKQNGFSLPADLESWAEFDFIGSVGPWVSPRWRDIIENFKFYNQHYWDSGRIFSALLQKTARLRCQHNYYRLPVEKMVTERINPPPKLS